MGTSIDLTENIAGWIAVSQYPNVNPFWADLICKANEAKWNWIYVEIGIVTFGFIVSVICRVPRLYRKTADFFWPNAAAKRKAAAAAASQKKDDGEGVVNGENTKATSNDDDEVQGSSQGKQSSKTDPREATPRKRKVVKK